MKRAPTDTRLKGAARRLLLAGLALLSVVLPCRFALPLTLASVSDKPSIITVVMDDNYPPYIFRNSAGEVQGVLVDLWQRWSRITGVEVVLVATDWGKAQRIMGEGRADVIDTIFYSEQRAARYDFSKPYATLEVPIFHHKSLGGITGPDSLRGFTIGVKTGDACIGELKRSGVSTFKEYGSYEEVVKGAIAGEVKVFCVDKPPALYYLYKFNVADQFLEGFVLYSGEFHRAVAKGRGDLLRLLEEGFKAIPAQDVQAIERRWLGAPLYNPDTVRLVSYAMVAVALLTGVLAAFNIALRRSVRAKTRELQRLLAALRESDERWHFALEGSGAGVWDWNLITNEVYFSDRWKSMLGYRPDELQNTFRQWQELLHPGDVERAHKHLDEFLAGHSPKFALEHRLRGNNGAYRWILALGKIVGRDSVGKPLRMIGTHTDISDRREAEDALRRALAFNEMLLEHSPVGVLVYEGTEGKCLLANHVAAGMLGLSLPDLLRLPLMDVPGLNAASADSLARRTLDGESPLHGDLRLRPGSDGAGMAYCTFARLDVNGTLYLLVIAVDVAERTRMYALMADTEKMMTVGGLAAGMAHEINNPLAGILQSTQSVLRRLTPGLPSNQDAAREIGFPLPNLQAYCAKRGVYDLLQGVIDSGTKAARIVSNMLDFARRPGGTMIPADLGELLDRALELCASEYDMKKRYDFRKVEIVRQYDHSLPPVPCIPSQIEQVAMNILRNAAQALAACKAEDRPPTIVIRTSRENGFARIDFLDNGPGIDAAALGKVFEPFFTTKAVGEGTGLGLSVSYFIVANAHRGSIQAESTPGRGATFTVRLPLVQPQDEAQ